jgi:hypothetical protein
MKLDTLRMIVGFSIILSHLVSFFLILIGTDKFTTQERMELSLLISPIFAVYVTAIVRQFVRQDPNYDATPTHPALRILSIGTALIFGVSVPLTVYKFVTGVIDDFSSLKMILGILETALGIYTGAVVDRLFGGVAERDGELQK